MTIFFAEFSGITALLLRFSIHVMDSCNADPGIEHLEGIREFRKGGPCQPCLFINQNVKIAFESNPSSTCAVIRNVIKYESRVALTRLWEFMNQTRPLGVVYGEPSLVYMRCVCLAECVDFTSGTAGPPNR